MIMDEGTTSCRAFAPDVLTDILMRLPPNTRRRLRLVCRHWRHVVDTRTATDLRNRAKTAVITWETAFVFDDLSTDGRRPRELWSRAMAERFRGLSIIGTCNGIICLCDDQKRGAITLVNPITGEMLSIPELPSPYAGGNRKWHKTYSFAYHPTTGRYKIVHVPRYLDRVLVFTLGEASWRDVPMIGGGARCDLNAGIVSADGYMYLAVEGTKARIMSFDLNHENFASLAPLPDILSRPGSWGLAEVHGRLGITFTHVSQNLVKIDVWVMEGMPGQLKWNCWYILQDHQPRNQAYRQSHHRQYLARPHFAHSGKYVLTRPGSDTLFRHMANEDTRKARHGVVEITEKNRGTMINSLGRCYNSFDSGIKATLCYVETTEPLSVYKCW